LLIGHERGNGNIFYWCLNIAKRIALTKHEESE